MAGQEVLSKEISKKLSLFMLGFIFIVVLFHSKFRYVYPFIEDLTAISTSYFFCISAFFFYRGLHSENTLARLKKRCITLLLPYILWNLIYIVLYLRIYKFSFEHIIRSITISPICTPSWYLVTLFIFFLPSSFIRRGFSKVPTMIILLMAGLSISYLGYIRFQAELASLPFVGGYLVRMAEYVTPYLIGGMIGTWFEKNISVSWKRSILGIVSGCGIIWLLCNDISVEARWFLWVIFPIILWNAVPEKIFKKINFLHIFTAPAFFINMLHCYLLFIVGLLINENEILKGTYYFAFKVIIAVMASYAIYYLLKLGMPKTLKLITGNRT